MLLIFRLGLGGALLLVLCAVVFAAGALATLIVTSRASVMNLLSAQAPSVPSVVKFDGMDGISQVQPDKRITGAKIIDNELHELIRLIVADAFAQFEGLIVDDEELRAQVSSMIQQATIRLSNGFKQIELESFLSGRLVDEFCAHVEMIRAAEAEAVKKAELGGEQRCASGKPKKSWDQRRVLRMDDNAVESCFFAAETRYAAICQDPSVELAYCRDLAEVLCCT